MRFAKFLTAAVIFTILALVYTHLQVQIYRFGYQAELKKTELQKQGDVNGYLSENILRLKSANYLGVKLLGSHSQQMKFVDHSHVITLKTPASSGGERISLRDSKKQGTWPNLLAGVFSLKSQAEAGSIK